MKKLNKKGFTLVEMLVVIAIIAVLVAIIVPTVSNSTKKAKAAADAANLRSVAAEVEVYCLTNNVDITGDSVNVPEGSYTNVTSKTDGTTEVTVTISKGVVTAKFGDKTAADFAAIANGGNAT